MKRFDRIKRRSQEAGTSSSPPQQFQSDLEDHQEVVDANVGNDDNVISSCEKCEFGEYFVHNQ